MVNEDKMYDYYYSESIEKYEREHEKDKPQCNVFVNSRWYVFTECIKHGREPLSNTHDLVLIGTIMENKDSVFYGEIKEAKRKIIVMEERKCDGYCQWCNLDCHVKTVVDK